jgi:hypothetical protein
MADNAPLNGVFTQYSDLNDVLTQDSYLNGTHHLSQNPV